MKEQIIYLDSSAIIKRYVKEPGSKVVRSIYLKRILVRIRYLLIYGI